MKNIWKVLIVMVCCVLVAASARASDYAKLGFVDVTLFGADPSGKADSTQAITHAAYTAMNKQMAVFFPEGTYTVSTPIELKVPFENWDNKVRPGFVLIGSTAGKKRPVIKLADHSSAFAGVKGGFPVDDSDLRITPVLHFWREREGEPTRDQPDENYNQVIRGIDFDLGTGNPGAVAIRMRACKECAITDVKINAAGGFAGLYDLIGSGGSITGLEVIGGEYGVYAPDSQPGPLITGLRLSRQSKLGIYYHATSALTVVGFEMKQDRGPVVGGLSIRQTKSGGVEEASSSLLLIDGTIEITSPDTANPLIRNTDRAVYLKNVYVKNASTLMACTDSFTTRIARPDRWTNIVEYAYSKKYDHAVRIINGKPVAEPLVNIADAAATPPADLITRHVWEGGEKFCSFEKAGVVNVMDFGAKGDGTTDDTAAIQRAIEAGSEVFLPHGTFIITKTLRLKSNTRLFGVSRVSTVIRAGDWTEASSRQLVPMITTPDDANATTVLSSFKLEPPRTDTKINAIKWMAGRHSIVRDVWVFPKDFGNESAADQPLQRIVITGNGGGKWYNQLGMVAWDTKNPESRHVLVDGTHEPLAFYMFHNQYMYAFGSYMSEVRNAANVTFYASKGEGLQPGAKKNPKNSPWPMFLGVTGSSNIGIYGFSGNFEVQPGQSILDIKDCRNVTIANVGRYMGNVYPKDKWFFVRETSGDVVNTIDATTMMNLLKRE